jgi:hypothetical protein
MSTKEIKSYTLIFGNNLTIVNNESGWKIIYPNRQPIVKALRASLKDDSMDNNIASWIESIELCSTTMGDGLFSLQLSFASFACMVRQISALNKDVADRLKSVISKTLSNLDECRSEYCDILSSVCKDYPNHNGIELSQTMTKIINSIGGGKQAN